MMKPMLNNQPKIASLFLGLLAGVILVSGPVAVRAQSAHPEMDPPSFALPVPRRDVGPPATLSASAPVINGPLTLDQLENLAQAYNPILQRDLARIESARGGALQASLYKNPRFDTNNPEVFAGRDSLLNVGIQQEIVVKGKQRLDTAAANQVTREAEIAFHQDRFGLLTAVRFQFFTVLAAKRRVQVLEELLTITRQAMETGRKLEKAQETSRIDTLLLTNDYQQIQANLSRTRSILNGERKQLAAVVGVAEVQTADLLGDLSGPKPEFDEELVRQYAVTSSTSVQHAHAEITRNEIVLQRAKVEPYPNINVGPAYQFGVKPGNEQFWFTITFPIPVWDRNQGNIRSAQADVRNAQETLRTIQNDQLQLVADTLAHYKGARRLVDQYEREILPNLQRTLRLAQEGYAKGVFDFARYLQAQRTVVEANLNYLDALADLWTTAAKVAGLLQLEQFR